MPFPTFSANHESVVDCAKIIKVQIKDPRQNKKKTVHYYFLKEMN